MTEWSQSVWIGINLLLAAFVISVMVYFTNMGYRINNEISKQEAHRELMREYREFNAFNNNVVYAQDVVSAVMHYRGDIGIRIIHASSENSYWCSDEAIKDALTSGVGLTNSQGESAENWGFNSTTTPFTATSVQERLDVNKVYMGSLTYGANGEVLGVTFIKGSMNSHNEFVAD